uniref:Glycerol-3-phosphate dehydrogenase NAD-dependent C-terminal domain-containing protein n=1 Tax=Timema douglasi TaxID=61478 RepID=A0A7R8VXZ3_TIMDO|nr:unnamed protein product [Timema douglasi]
MTGRSRCTKGGFPLFLLTNSVVCLQSIEELEKELLNGQKLQGPITALEVNHMLKNKSMDDKFPLFTAIHRICVGELKPDQLINCIREHPEHIHSRAEQALFQPRSSFGMASPKPL